MRVLSIDALANRDYSWEWNYCSNVGNIEKPEFEALSQDEDFIQWFVTNSYLSKESVDKFCIYDDQYYIVLCTKDDMRPFYAIEYGIEY